MKKILLAFGTRPEAIKMAPLVKEFQKYPISFKTIVCVTGQHRELLDQVLQLFEINPDYDLNIMKASQDLYDITTQILLGMRDIINKVEPDLILVHGDTSTSTAVALAAFYQQTPVAHIEAGLRTYNIYSPWPEEMNRQLTSRIATYHFAPTSLSKQNLLNEGIKEEKIYITGNTVIDALHLVLDKIKNDTQLNQSISSKIIEAGIPFDKLDAWNTKDIKKNRKLILITGHRRENFGEGFLNICNAIKELAENFPDSDFVYPMHLNPNVRSAIKKVFGKTNDIAQNQINSNTFFIEPLEYLQFIKLMNVSYIVLTDSGGIQEEAPGLGKPVLVMRDTTERPEAIHAGTVKLVGTIKQNIIKEVTELIQNTEYYTLMSTAINPYGDGRACERIYSHISTIIKIPNYNHNDKQ